MLSGRRFLPLFLTQFTGALNDNFFKSALVVLLTYRLAGALPVRADILVTLSSGIFILPFFLFSAVAGQLADTFDKAMIARRVKVAEILLLAAGGLGFYLAQPWLLLSLLFGMGVHSTFFGPVKYALLPQHVPPEHLTMANGFVEAGTFIAIVLGTVLGGALILLPQGALLVAGSLMALAVFGYGASRFIPPAPAPAGIPRVRWNILAATGDILRPLFARAVLRRPVLLISWFWLMGAVYLAQMPAFAKTILGGDEYVLTFLLAAFSLGIGIGSIVCGLWRKPPGQESRRLALAMLGMALLGFILHLIPLPQGTGPALMTLREFLATGSGWAIFFCLLGLAICAGLFVVPLYTRLQKTADKAFIARIMAGLNVVNALFMVAGALASAVLLKAGFSARDLFLFLAVAHSLLGLFLLSRKGNDA